jgi:hypothetical protein
MRPLPPRPPTDDPLAREREQLATMLALMLVIMFGGAFIVFLIFISLGLFLWVLVASACIAAYTLLHYAVWGRTSRIVDRDECEVPEDWPRELLDRRGRFRSADTPDATLGPERGAPEPKKREQDPYGT